MATNARPCRAIEPQNRKFMRPMIFSSRLLPMTTTYDPGCVALSRVKFERTLRGEEEIEAESYSDAREKALKMEAFEIDWALDQQDGHLEVVDIEEILPDDDD